MNFPIEKQKGLSLIELMVAMALSLFLIAGVIQLVIGVKQSFQITRDLSDMQENGQMAVTFVSESIRMADHWGGLENPDVTGTGTLSSSPGACNAAWVFNTSVALQGYEGASSAPSAISNCITDYVADSDLVVVRYADARRLYSDAQISGTEIYVRTSLLNGAQVFNGADSADAINDIPLVAGVLNFSYATELYYVRSCSIKTGTTCLDTIPTLVRLTIVEDAPNQPIFREEVLVEGVEQLQFEYGVDTDNDQVLDVYQSVASVADWSDVMSVRLSLIARASQLDISVNDTTVYAMAGGYDYTPDTTVSQFRRKQYNKEVHIRNRSRL